MNKDITVNHPRALQNTTLRETLAAQRKTKLFDRDLEIVAIATEMAEKRTRKGSTARRVVTLILEQYPYSTAEGERGQAGFRSKTRVTIDTVTEQFGETLSLKQLEDEKGVEFGIRVARQLLDSAHAKLSGVKRESSTKPAQA